MVTLHNATAYNGDLDGTPITITDAALFWLEPADGYDGIVNFEISPDSGTTWFGVEAQDLTSKVKESLVSPPREGRIYKIDIPGTFQLRMSGGTQGSLSAYAELISENGTSAVTVANGADATQGSTTDAAATAGGTGTISAKLRRVTQQLADLLTGIILAAGENHIGEVGGRQAVVSTSFSRPGNTNAYAARDAVSNATSSASVLTFSNLARVSGGSGYIVKARLLTDQNTNTARFRLHLFHTSPSALNDNDPYTLLWDNRANRIGFIDFDAMSTEGTGSTAAYSTNVTSRMPFTTVGSRNIFGMLETLDGFTPANGQNFFIELTADVN